MMENLAVEQQASKPVPSPRVIDVDAGPERPVVEITASPVTREPIVRFGARRKQPSAITPAAASVQAGNGGTTSRTEKIGNAAADPKPASTAIAADQPEAAPMEPEELGTQAEEMAAQSHTPMDRGALQQGKARARQAIGNVVAKAQGLVGPVKDKVGEMRAKFLTVRSKERVGLREDDAADAKGDLQRIAATLDGKSGAGDGGR